MVNDTIVNARNFSDRLCNEVILWSNDFARDLGVTYGELLAGITIFVYDVMPLKKKRPELFPMVLAAFANHLRWFIDHLSEIETMLDRYDAHRSVNS